MSNDAFVERFDIDDISCLHPNLRKIYKNPYRTFGLDPAETNTTQVRDAFRKAMLGFCFQFMGMQKSSLKLEQVVLSYHLLRKTLRGPAQNLKEQMAKTTYMKFDPQDILPLLRPIGKSRPLNEKLGKEINAARARLGLKLVPKRVESDFKCPPEYRGFANLNVHFHEVRYDRSLVHLYGTMKYSFTVNYCMRKHRIEKTLEECMSLHKLLLDDQLQVPDFPVMPLNVLGLNAITQEEYGERLAEYITRNHETLASAGEFNPRMLKWLHIDFERVQSEEEGAIMALLDTETPIPRSCWYMIDEKWLQKWRRFAMGRGPRRYLPPGRISNSWLIETAALPGRHVLVKAEHYRCVNVNVWTFYQMVHLGGPCISRSDQDLYSDRALSFTQAIIYVQCRIRVYLARKLRDKLYTEHLSWGTVGRGILAGEIMKENKSFVHRLILSERRQRLDSKVRIAVSNTQKLWRKKAKAVPEENLARSRADQLIFARSKQGDGDLAVSSDIGVVVRDVHPIINVGTTSLYKEEVEEDEFMGRIPFEIQKVPWSEQAIISLDPITRAVNPIRFVPGSKILTVNDEPTSLMTFQEFKEKLRTSPWPLKFDLERPIAPEKVMTWQKLSLIADEGLLYSAFKVFMQKDIPLIRHNPDEGFILAKKPWLTRIVLSDTHLYYKHKLDTMKTESDHWRSFSLFSIKFVSSGEDIDRVERLSRHPSHVFSIRTQEKEYIFEMPTEHHLNKLLAKEELKKLKNKRPDELTRKGADESKDKAPGGIQYKEQKLTKKQQEDENKDAAKRAAIVIKCMRHLVAELRRNQTFVDTSGIPTMRKSAKTTLRKVV